jgi:hypothetical protein
LQVPFSRLFVIGDGSNVMFVSDDGGEERAKGSVRSC